MKYPWWDSGITEALKSIIYIDPIDPMHLE